MMGATGGLATRATLGGRGEPWHALARPGEPTSPPSGSGRPTKTTAGAQAGTTRTAGLAMRQTARLGARARSWEFGCLENTGMPSKVGGYAIVSDPTHCKQRITWQPGGPVNRPTGIGGEDDTATDPILLTAHPGPARPVHLQQQPTPDEVAPSSPNTSAVERVGWEALTHLHTRRT